MSSHMMILGGRGKLILRFTTLVTPMEGALQPGLGICNLDSAQASQMIFFLPSLSPNTIHESTNTIKRLEGTL